MSGDVMCSGPYDNFYVPPRSSYNDDHVPFAGPVPYTIYRSNSMYRPTTVYMSNDRKKLTLSSGTRTRFASGFGGTMGR
jgi:hypothetical protein